MNSQNIQISDKREMEAEFNLFCLPSAGSSASMYYAWKELAPDSWHVVPIEYPGHGSKVAKPLIHEPEQLAQDVSKSIEQKPLRPFVLFGHSMGAALIWHVEQYLKNSPYYDYLRLMVVSGRPEHSHIRHMPHKHKLSINALKAELKRYNGTYQEILDNDDVLDFFLVILRNDFHLSDNMLTDIVETASVPFVAFYGKDDPDIPKEIMMNTWASHTTQWLVSYSFTLDYFYFNNQQTSKMLLEKVHSVLQLNA